MSETQRLKDGFMVQNACNIRGVTNSLNKLICELHDEGGMDLVRTDPTPRLFLAKILDMLGVYEQVKALDVYDAAAIRLKELDPAAAKELKDFGLGYCSKEL